MMKNKKNGRKMWGVNIYEISSKNTLINEA